MPRDLSGRKCEVRESRRKWIRNLFVVPRPWNPYDAHMQKVQVEEPGSTNRRTVDKHLNLFYTYNTHHLEDNVTRAFAITLANLSPVHLRLFLKELLSRQGEKSRAEVKDKICLMSKPRFQFDLQVRMPQEEERLNESNGLIVGINYSGAQELSLDDQYIADGGCRPDMSVSDLENEVTVIFEAKLRDDLYRAQIQRHFNQFFDTTRTKLDQVFLEVSWSDIADFLSRLEEQSLSPVENLVLNQFNEYLDFAHLTDFIPFRESDFVGEGNYDKLHKFLAFLTPRLPTELGLSEYNRDNKLFFNGIEPDNIWVDYVSNALSVMAVIGSGKKWRSRQIRDWVARSRDILKHRLASLQESLKPPIPIYLRLNSYFRLSKFRTEWLGNVGGERRFPDDYERFCTAFIDERINSYGQMTKQTIMEVFHNEIRLIDKAKLDSHGLFPRWEVPSDFGQYCYFDIELRIPQARLVGKAREDFVPQFAEIFRHVRNFMSELVAAKLE
jgi:hypothetical protein